MTSKMQPFWWFIYRPTPYPWLYEPWEDLIGVDVATELNPSIETVDVKQGLGALKVDSFGGGSGGNLYKILPTEEINNKDLKNVTDPIILGFWHKSLAKDINTMFSLYFYPDASDLSHWLGLVFGYTAGDFKMIFQNFSSVVWYNNVWFWIELANYQALNQISWRVNGTLIGTSVGSYPIGTRCRVDLWQAYNADIGTELFDFWRVSSIFEYPDITYPT